MFLSYDDDCIFPFYNNFFSFPWFSLPHTYPPSRMIKNTLDFQTSSKFVICLFYILVLLYIQFIKIASLKWKIMDFFSCFFFSVVVDDNHIGNRMIFFSCHYRMKRTQTKTIDGNGNKKSNEEPKWWNVCKQLQESEPQDTFNRMEKFQILSFLDRQIQNKMTTFLNKIHFFSTFFVE